MALITHVQRFIDNAVAYQRRLIAVAESQRAARAVGDACVADTLVRDTGMSRGAARRAARQAKTIAAQPQVAGALACGDINTDQAEAIARADVSDQTRRELVAAAASEGTDATRERAAAAETAARDETPEQRFMRQHANRFLRFYNNRDGMVCLEGALDPDSGARLKAKVSAITNRMWRTDKQQPPSQRRTPEQRDIDALCAATSQPRRASSSRSHRSTDVPHHSASATPEHQDTDSPSAAASQPRRPAPRGARSHTDAHHHSASATPEHQETDGPSVAASQPRRASSSHSVSGSAATHRPGSSGIEPQDGAVVTTTDIDAGAEGGQFARATTEAKQTRARAAHAETDPTKAGAAHAETDPTKAGAAHAETDLTKAGAAHAETDLTKAGAAHAETDPTKAGAAHAETDPTKAGAAHAETDPTKAGAAHAETDPTKAGASVTVARDRKDTCGEDLDGDSLDDDVDWADFDDSDKRVVPVLRVSTSLDALRSGLHRAGVSDSGENLSAATLRRLACDAEIIPTVLNGKGRVIDVGRRTRRVGEALRCVLIARDGGCVWPGCDGPPSRCDAHHVKHWADGGPTNADNLALLCHRHHILLHEGGHHLQCHGDSWVVLKPDGTRLHKPLAAALGDIGSSGLSVRDSIGFYSAGVDSPVDRPTDADSEFDAPRRSTNGSTAASPRQLTLACDSRRELSIRLKSPAPAMNAATTSATHLNRSRDGDASVGPPTVLHDTPQRAGTCRIFRQSMSGITTNNQDRGRPQPRGSVSTGLGTALRHGSPGRGRPQPRGSVSTGLGTALRHGSPGRGRPQPRGSVSTGLGTALRHGSPGRGRPQPRGSASTGLGTALRHGSPGRGRPQPRMDPQPRGVPTGLGTALRHGSPGRGRPQPRGSVPLRASRAHIDQHLMERP